MHDHDEDAGAGAEPDPSIRRRQAISKVLTAGAVAWSAPLILASGVEAGGVNSPLVRTKKVTPTGTCRPGKLYAIKYHRIAFSNGPCWNPVSFGFTVRDSNNVPAIYPGCALGRTDVGGVTSGSTYYPASSVFTFGAGKEFAGAWQYAGNASGAPTVQAQQCYSGSGPTTYTHQWPVDTWSRARTDYVLILAYWGPPS